MPQVVNAISMRQQVSDAPSAALCMGAIFCGFVLADTDAVV
jgi:hypothetical protein